MVRDSKDHSETSIAIENHHVRLNALVKYKSMCTDIQKIQSYQILFSSEINHIFSQIDSIEEMLVSYFYRRDARRMVTKG